jgi:hypothetical protein
MRQFVGQKIVNRRESRFYSFFRMKIGAYLFGVPVETFDE